MRSRFLEVGQGVRVHAMEAGPAEGPLVLLLHGFPDFWACWRAQIPVLADAGFRVLAVDLPGYNRSDQPRDLAFYRLESLAERFAEMIARESAAPTAVVGHDWGGAITWTLARRHPDRLRAFVSLNCPDPDVMVRRLRRDPEQLARSWYMFFFQLPRLPEWWLARGGYRMMEREFLAEAGTTFSSRLDEYRQAWSRKGALTAMLGVYRAALRRLAVRSTAGALTVPGMLIWGNRDRHQRAALAEDCRRLHPALRVEVLDGVSHWTPQEAPDRVNALLLAFLAEAFH